MSGAESIPNSRPLRVLALDGGGVRGLASLLILRRLMYRIDNEDPPKPCDIFDVIAGTSTGGLIAIMLGRLEMDLDTAIEAYRELAEKVFVPRTHTFFLPKTLSTANGSAVFDKKKLENAIKETIGPALKRKKETGSAESAPLLEKQPGCKMFVCTAMPNAKIQRLRNYRSINEEATGCTIWQAAFATSAAPTFFDPIRFTKGPDAIEYRDGAVVANNPIFELVREIHEEFPDVEVSTIVSIGTGVSEAIKLGDKLIDMAIACSRIAMDTEKVANEFMETHCLPGGKYHGKYFRFNTTQGLQGIGLQEWKRMHEINYSTTAYLGTAESRQKLEACVGSLREAANVATPPVNENNLKNAATRYFQSLRFQNIQDRYDNIKDPHTLTCHWLLDNDYYKTWWSKNNDWDDQKILWLKGNPGSGKSTLMKYILDNARRSNDNDIHISFFFNARGDELGRSVTGLYRSLLFQLMATVPQVKKVFNKLEILDLPRLPADETVEELDWSIPQLQRVLEGAATEIQGRWIRVYIDALDECHVTEVGKMIRFLGRLSGIARKSDSFMRVIFASRPYPRIIAPQAHELSLHHENGHAHDIQTYIQSELRIYPQINDADLASEIERRASGSFLWIDLVVDLLIQACQDGEAHLSQSLQTIPDSLSSIYGRILRKDTEGVTDLWLCLAWVLYAREPLTRSQLYFALRSGGSTGDSLSCHSNGHSTEVMDAFILKCSRGLLEMTHSSPPTVQFIHETVREFLKEEGGLCTIRNIQVSDLEGAAHESLQLCCANYISLFQRAVDEGNDRLSIFRPRIPFMMYAVQHVLQHANSAQRNGNSQTSFIKNFDFDRWIALANRNYPEDESYNRALIPSYIQDTPWTHIERWSWNRIRECPPGSSPLFVFAVLDLAALAEAVLLSDSTATIDGQAGRSPLRQAIIRSRREVVRAFLTPNRPLSQRSLDQAGFDSLFLTLWCAEIRHGPTMISMLQYFFAFGLEPEILLLVRSGRFDLNSEISEEQKLTPISIAAERGLESVIKFLISCSSVELDPQDRHEPGPLAKAIRRGRLNIVQLLLEDTKRVNINTECPRGRSALSYAAEQQDPEILEFLLRHRDINLNSRDTKGWTPFLHAVNAGNFHHVMLLHNAGADIKIPNDVGQSALFQAVLKGHLDIVKLLLRIENFDINVRDEIHGFTPLWAAISTRRPDIVETLLEDLHIDVNIRATVNGDNQHSTKIAHTALSWVAAIGDEKILNSLLRRNDINPDEPATFNRTPLSFAAENGKVEVVKVLLGKTNVEPNSVDSQYGRTPLWWAAERGHCKVVELFLEQETVLADKQDRYGSTPLAAAARNGHEAVVRILLNCETVNPNSHDNYGLQPVDLAFRQNHGSIGELLL